MRSMLVRSCFAVVVAGSTHAGSSFVNWESPHVNPLAMTPDGGRLLAVNTADNRLEVFQTTDSGLAHAGSVPVGLDPVSVRAFSANEAWVVNHVSDTVSVVDLDALNVRATIRTGDEPADIVFAGAPLRAFVSVSQLNRIEVFDPADLTSAPLVVEVAGEDPRALATDGTRVYAAIFESGNDTSIIGEHVVSSNVNPYPGRPNPPPNAGSGFDPPIDPKLPSPPEVSHIVLRDDNGDWVDANGADWSAAVGWDVHGHDIAVIDAGTLAVSYVSGVMNANMNVGVSPAGDVYVVGTEAMNHVRFEPNLNGVFVRTMGASFAAPASAPSVLLDLNPHLDYTTGTVAQPTRDESLGDPRGLAFDATGRVFISGLGSNNVVATDAALNRVGRVEVGAGPTGLAYRADTDTLYALNRFEGTVSVIDADALVETGRIAFYDPTPAVIRAGRPHLYDTHRTSGLGQASCASCHIDARMDQVAWDLGDPAGDMKGFNQVCNFGIGGCEDWHPMKGPMATQTLVGIIGTGPLHWRADREDLAAFNGAFESLLGDDSQLSDTEMAEFEAFVATLTPPPNPFRSIADNLQSNLPNGGNAITGRNLYMTGGLDVIDCVTCHALPTGTNGELTSAPLLEAAQSMKIPQLRNMHEKTGFDQTSNNNNRGFGYIHDGSVDTLFSFLEFDGFRFSGGETGNQQRRDVTAFLLSFATDTHAGVGVQATIGGDGEDQTAFRDQIIAVANLGDVGLVVKGAWDGEARGAYFLGGDEFQTDRADQTLTTADLDDRAGPGAEITYTLVPLGSEVRIGVDRDEDSFFDRDELDVCADPADPKSVPGKGGCTCPADIDGSGAVDFGDILAILSAWGNAGGPEDVDGSGTVDFGDVLMVLSAWGVCS